MPSLCEKNFALCAEKVNQPCVGSNQTIILQLKRVAQYKETKYL